MATAFAQEEADRPSPFQTVAASEKPATTEEPAVTFKQPPQTRLSITTSRTHKSRAQIDPAGLHRLSSSVLGSAVRTSDGQAVGRARDLVLGPNGAVEFVVIENGDRSFVIPYDVATLDEDEDAVNLPLTNRQFRDVPTFEGTAMSLKSSEYRQRLHAAYKEAETLWGVPQAALEPTVARSAVPRPTPHSAAKPAASTGDTRSAPGLSVLAQPQGPQANPNATRTVVIPGEQPSADGQQTGAPQVVAPIVIAPSVGRRIAAPGNAARNNARAVQGTENFAPTAPINPRFPTSGSAFPSQASQPNSTTGNTSSNSGITTGAPRTNNTPNNNVPNTNAPANGQQIPASTPGNRTAPTTSPSGTKYPARVP
ncbi:MAG: PRC-barrel domain-containing protein [Planctomycetaceae bacterium]|nr:PRC-barrel domain-containing protein [Planctomycetaceae bacterium]